MLEYAGFFLFMMAAWLPVVAGVVLTVGLVGWSAWHLARGRPAWYAGKILKGAIVGALVGGAAVFVSELVLGPLWPWPFAVGAGAGYGALATARAHFADRLSARTPV